MSIVNFVKFSGNKVASCKTGPTIAGLKKSLEDNNFSSEKVKIIMRKDKINLQGEVATRESLEKIVLSLGNHFGISIVDTTKVTVIEKGCTSEITYKGHLVYYIVKKYDNLRKIAEKIYGKNQGNKSYLIFKANQPMLSSPNDLYLGQALRVPVLD